MNSIHRIGLTIAGVAGALTMAGALAIQGYASDQAAAQATPAQQAAAETQGATGPTADPTALDPETVYVNPAPTPAVITVIQTAPPTRTRRQANPPVIHIIVPGYGEGDGGDGGGN
jgi:hypothetical protein